MKLGIPGADEFPAADASVPGVLDNEMTEENDA